jgi:hypothetical protein
MLIKSTMHLMTYVVILGISSLVGGVYLGFGSLRTLEGQFGLLGRRTLLFVVPTYGGDHRTYALQTIQADVCRTAGCMLLFGIPSG